ncbi:hypothetical protein EWM64_g566 [Hericium alpestre]|uniref:Blue (type 1) copper domain-containing protein n=1 Tax=Hericium alpestre TaxID=135208 RepID=A0A4Z0ACL0_9AGAM|nr:hypothetical protein EWM64_g566 [Hericium alpestre]
MKFTSALVGLLLPVLAVAQYGPPPGPAPASPPSASSSSSGAIPSAPPSTSTAVNVRSNHLCAFVGTYKSRTQVDVAAGEQFVFNPSNFTAANGTTVTFFFPNAGITHSVTQSNFSNPCAPLQASGQNGFDSGLQAGVQYTITITDDSVPIWFFCKQVSHCGLGMVGSINAPTSGSNTYDAFRSAALAIGANEPMIQDNGPVTGGVDAQATATPANTVSASGSSSSGSSGSSSSSDATRVAVSGAFGLVALIAAAVFV